MSAPILRTAAQAVKTAPAVGAIDTVAAARTTVTSTARSSALTASITQQTATASRTIATSSKASSSAVLDKTITETLRDTARVVDQTASDGLEKAVELAESAMKLAKENDGAAEAAGTSATFTAKATSTSISEGGIAKTIQSEAVGAFEELGEATQQTQSEGGQLGILASIERLAPDFSSPSLINR
ncbi:hypothetical protein H072_8263 [Dactylellina haptotyla CBS 200.50]|uniref:Uncharacterized protein n=1 Tax=Dactylellina haptotyla (strain CBS 200.50) TaxID=1284197 RepID=S8A5C9_DACHA|nr:hypothetical protein H072_8263 [Dactylellina haptotyla CBS 200.50]